MCSLLTNRAIIGLWRVEVEFDEQRENEYPACWSLVRFRFCHTAAVVPGCSWTSSFLSLYGFPKRSIFLSLLATVALWRFRHEYSSLLTAAVGSNWFVYRAFLMWSLWIFDSCWTSSIAAQAFSTDFSISFIDSYTPSDFLVRARALVRPFVNAPEWSCLLFSLLWRWACPW